VYWVENAKLSPVPDVWIAKGRLRRRNCRTLLRLWRLRRLWVESHKTKLKSRYRVSRLLVERNGLSIQTVNDGRLVLSSSATSSDLIVDTKCPNL